ncbi:MAG: uridine kinase [Oligoflexales bacterium]
MTKRSPLIVAISGGSGAGKTTFLNAVVKLVNHPYTWLKLDDYYRDLSHLSAAERDRINFDDPGALELDLFAQDLKKLVRGEKVEHPLYDFTTHTRKGMNSVKAERLIFVDGIFTLVEANMRESYNLSIYLDVANDIRFYRRLSRDTKERGRGFDNIVSQYFATVKPMHERHVEPTKVHADMILPWDVFNQRAVEVVAKYLHQALSQGGKS